MKYLKLRWLLDVYRYLGPRWIFFKGCYALKRRIGWFKKKAQLSSWDDHSLKNELRDVPLAGLNAYLKYRRSQALKFFFSALSHESLGPFFSCWDTKDRNPFTITDRLEQGKLQYFSNTFLEIGFPPNWHHNPLTGQTAPFDRHWSQIGDFECGDIKLIWEPNRFGYVYALVRAYLRTGDERYPELFWRLVEDWRRHNPPNCGVNWKCGQEISIRLMAWLFGLYGFLSAPSTTPKRVADLAKMISLSADRIEKNITYALSLKNNHGISEALGLWTVGLQFPEFRGSERWLEKGRYLLEKLAIELIYDDGSFVQHSFNYHRLMLQAYTWALRLGELSGMTLSDRLKERLLKACLFLYQVQDECTGQTPNYGQNDGALILPLSNCDYRDYRPAIQLTHCLLTGARCYPDGPWNEDLLWLLGPASLQTPIVQIKRSDLQAKAGGYYTLRTDGEGGFVFVRCADYQHRPGQADMLHVDLWWRGVNVVLDPGTYSYNAPHPWNNALAHTVFHNTMTVDGRDQMDQVGKFLWLPWVTGHLRVKKDSSSGFFTFWEGEHDGYRRLRPPASHVRSILKLGDEHWLFLDELISRGVHRYRLHWLLSDFPYIFEKEQGSVTLATPEGSYRVALGSNYGMADLSLMRADENSPLGWCSHYYHDKEPAIAIAADIHDRCGFFYTLFGPDGFTCHFENEILDISTTKWRCVVNLNMDRTDTKNMNIFYAHVTGQLNERFEIN